MEKNVEDVLVSQFYLLLESVKNPHVGSNPASTREILHTGQVHVHHPSIEASLPIVRNLQGTHAVAVGVGTKGMM